MRLCKTARWGGAAGVALYLFGCWGCSATTATPDAAATPVDLEPPFDFAAARRIPVQAMQWSFNPSTIDVNLGEHVYFDVTTLDRTHGFNIYDFGIDVSIQPNMHTLVPLVPDKVGSFNFHCDIYCGSGHEGMAGLLVVHP